MSQTIVVGFDASDSGNRALDFAIGEAKAKGATLLVAHVLEWSPYTFLTPEEIEERHKRRTEELARAETAVLAPVLERVRASGVKAGSELKYGNIGETLCNIAKDHGASQIVIGRTGHSEFAARVFGSVAGTLAQASPVPVTIVP